MADEQFFNDKRNDLDGDGIVDEKDINIMAHSAAAQAKVEKNMMEDVSVYNLRKIYEEKKGKHMENENKSPEEQLRDKVIAHEENEQEAREFNAMVKEGKVKGLTDEEKELKAANKEMKENEAEYSFNDREREDKDLERDEGVAPKKIDTEEVEADTKPKDKKVDEEEVEANSKTKTKDVEEEEVDNKPKDKKVDEKEVDDKAKTKDAEIDGVTPKQNTTDIAQPQPQQVQPQMQPRAASSIKGQEAVNEILTGLAGAAENLGGLGLSGGMIFNGLCKGVSAVFLKLKENYNGEEYRPPEATKAIGNGVANFMQDIVRDAPPEFNNPMTQAIINSFRLTPNRDANVNRDDQGNFVGDVVEKPKDVQTEMTEKMIKDRLVNPNTMGLIGSIHLAGGTERDKDGQLVLKDDVYKALETKLDKKEVAALGASLYAVNNPDKLDKSDRHINAVVEMAKGFNEPEKLEKSLNVLYEAGGKELASNPERSTESILVSPANIVHVSQALKDTNTLDTKSFDKQLDAVTKGIKEVNQVNHTIVSRDASKSMSKILDFIQEREQSKDMSKGHDKERKQER